jgi:hypothetical protein
VVDMPVDRADRAHLVGLGVSAATVQLGVPSVPYSYPCSRDGAVLGVAVNDVHLHQVSVEFGIAPTTSIQVQCVRTSG